MDLIKLMENNFLVKILINGLKNFNDLKLADENKSIVWLMLYFKNIIFIIIYI